ncbi:MAG: hemolysin III family protein, partial [Eggerthellaceae bacterium]|nr:hemolysin III family protein [Eggerthellaceae bacterium]
SEFKPESELSDYARNRKRRRRARERDDYAGRDFTLGETVANSVSQGVAALLALVALVILVVVAIWHGGGVRLAAALVFAVPMVLAFLMSTLYHALQTERAKRVFKVLDNSSTYLLIAGAFTPYCLITLANVGGSGLCAAEWALAIAGIVIEAVWATRPRWMHGVIYAVMCVAFLAFTPALYAALPLPGFVLLVVALVVLAVSLGFRWFSGVRYLRFVFHLVAFAGCTCPFLSVVLFVI